MPLTERQRNLLQFINQLNQNLISDRLNSNGLIDFDFNLGFNLGGNNGGTTPPDNGNGGTTPPPGNETPTTIRESLLSLIGEQVEITTPFGVINGTLLNVQDDYVVMIEGNGDRTLVRMEKIELVSE
ncbi:DUF2642 domain-containing protein [Oceanobacillus sp. Castelsardo]|uniref:DUF2642 domain-containing protein n=1 Tax=Oceanobacillus sp. Castelsardo TaxID=1851204 RepID=UPI000839376A|nr:DUF2642 domain-containing protein [Oceanobacillus sp. Castelsardo]